MTASKVAVFTGAGASRAIGYPLTRELLPRVLAELKSGQLFKNTNGLRRDRRERAELRTLLHRLFPGMKSIRDDKLPLITDIFSLIEYAIASGESLPVGEDADLRRCRDLLKHAITDVLLGDFLKEWDEDREEDARGKALLRRFADWVAHFGHGAALVTTNYDIGLEYELYRRLGRHRVATALDLGFDWRDPSTDEERTRPTTPELRVYKLHGSLDVLRCSTCGYVYFNPWGAIAVQAFRNEIDSNNCCVCRDDARLQLHIVSPSLVRDIRDSNLLSVWRSALEWMRKADEWYIIGYSIPPEDLAIRSLLLRAYGARSRTPRVTIVQQGDADRARFELLFPGCSYESHGLETFLAPASRRLTRRRS